MKRENLFLGILLCLSVQFVDAQTNKIEVSGNVGVGTTNPSSKLHVKESNSGNKTYPLKLQNSSNATDTGVGMEFVTDGGFVGGSIYLNRDVTAGPRHSLRFNVNGGGSTAGAGVNALTIKDNGRIGIGVTNPSRTLHVKGTSIPLFEGISNSEQKFFSFKRTDSSQEAYLSYTGAAIAFGTNDIERLRITQGNGNIGIGVTNPASKLEVNGDISLSRSHKITFLEQVAGEERAYIRSTNGEGGDFNSLIFAVGAGDEALKIKANGNVGIGTINPDSKLSVEGKIHCREVLVDTEAFADYVFNVDYYLKPLEEVENFIKQEGHLEGFKSEKEIVEEGLNLKEVTVKQQEKIEELTLYLIELSKEVKSLKAQLNKQ